MFIYILAGGLWLLITILLSWYISGRGIDPEKHISIGLKAMALSYIAGVATLLAALIKFS